MKKALLIVSIVVFALLSGALTTLAQENTATIADIVVASAGAETPEFTVLLAAIQAADPAILEALSNPDAGLTVFAPSDAAFSGAFEALGVTAETVLADQAMLNEILLYHIVPGVFMAEDILALDGGLIGTALYNTALVVDAENVSVNDAAIVASNVVAANGVIHAIDSVLIPPVAEAPADPAVSDDPVADTGSLADVIIASAGADAPEFITLLAAVQAADPSVLETLTNGGPFTVFAPTDAAFAAALEALGVTENDLLGNTELLTTILAYHVVPGYFDAETAVSVAAEPGGVQFATLLPGTAVTIAAGANGVTVDSANIVVIDVVADNGIIHVIDGVLLPPADA